ncbi:DUF2325 domain-containing protein [Comamonas testosteroni]
MPYPEDDIDHVMQEHGALLRHYAQVQQRCSAQMQSQFNEIQHLQAQILRMRAQLVVLQSALAWECPRPRSALANISDSTAPPPATDHTEPEHSVEGAPAGTELEWLGHNLHEADLVICQTGCISHGAFWRLANHCKRTGKTCVLVDQPDALRIVRIQPADLSAPRPTEQIPIKDIS